MGLLDWIFAWRVQRKCRKIAAEMQRDADAAWEVYQQHRLNDALRRVKEAADKLAEKLEEKRRLEEAEKRNPVGGGDGVVH